MLKTINMFNNDKAMYHTLKNSEGKQMNIPIGDIHTVTGFCLEEINVDDKIQLSVSSFFTVKEIVEIRDHKGVFEDKTLAKNSYFKVIVE